MSRAGGRRAGEPLAAFSLAAIKKVPRRDLAIRFAFGAGISTVAGLLTIALGVRTGGLFLAFPAILPATLSLIEQEDSEREAVHDDTGAILGAASLLVFAALGLWLFTHFGAAVALPAAGFGWLACAVLLYLGLRLVLGRRHRADTR